MPQLIVNEIFHSIQGESSHAGFPCVFIRLTYCNLRCTYCDTTYAFHEGRPMSLDAILETVRGYGCNLVEVTGGEPLVQEGALALMTRLCDEGYSVLLETGGSLDISPVDSRVRRIVDFKCPGSGMESKNLWENVRWLTAMDEVKFVIGNREDFDWALEKMREHDIASRCPVLMSPVFGSQQPAGLARWIMESRAGVRMQLQLHKYIWDPAMRGV
jgi:7-carboxy-7-deazaguanine synthase